MNKIPKSITIGGQQIQVHNVDRCDNNDIGRSCLCGGYIEIADVFNKNTKQSDTSKVNTFYHELVHAILGTMGENELDSNEKFVCCFAGFLSDAMTNAYFKEEKQ